jgi:hypothetical protein
VLVSTINTSKSGFNGRNGGIIMTKTINITVEVYDGTKTEEIERIVSAALDNNGIDCTYDIEEVEE